MRWFRARSTCSAAGALPSIRLALLCLSSFVAAATQSEGYDLEREGAQAGIHVSAEVLRSNEESIVVAREALHVARADLHVIDGNDSPNHANISSSQTTLWRYPQDLLMGSYADSTGGLPSNVSEVIERSVEVQHAELRKRDEPDANNALHARQAAQRTAYISINTCSQPTWSGTGDQLSGPPQLQLFVGKSGNQSPGPGSSGQQEVIALEEGFVRTQVRVSSDLYFTIAAPSLTTDFRGSWTYDVAVSINNYYHGANDTVPFLYLVDTDTTSALMVTDNLTQANAADKVFQQWMNLSSPLPFTVFANDMADTRRMGIAYSYCGLDAIKQLGGNLTMNSGSGPFIKSDMITRGLGNKPKQQFLIGNLTSLTSYNVTLALVGNGVDSGKGVVGGGGTVWQPTTWTTKNDGNCQLLYDLPFCNEVAYAVPSNPNNYNISALTTLYDDYASQLYQNFSYSLQQISCNTTRDQQYSLARNCDDCARAYKQWLCAVTIPRCEDFTSDDTFLQPRNVGQQFFNGSTLAEALLNQQYQPMTGAPTLPGSPINQTWYSAAATNNSRNPTIIDDKIMPGPYKEVLPCEDLCYSLVQSCPAALQFSCPLPGRGLEVGYGQRPDSATDITCSFLGAVYYIDDANRMAPSTLLVLVIVAIAAMFTAW